MAEILGSPPLLFYFYNFNNMGVYYLIAVKYECDTLKVSVSLLSMSHEKVIAELTRGDHISIIALFDFLLSEAKKNTVSDIHIDPYDSHTRIRFRIDGLLHVIANLHLIFVMNLISNSMN